MDLNFIVYAEQSAFEKDLPVGNQRGAQRWNYFVGL